MWKALLILIAGGLSAADNFRVVYDRSVITDTIVFQQPASNARGVTLQDDFTVYCEGDCVVKVYRGGPTMTCAIPANCEITPFTTEESAATPRFKVYYTASSLGSAVLLGTTVLSFGPVQFGMKNLRMTRNGSNINYYIQLTSTSGSAIRFVVNTTVVQE